MHVDGCIEPGRDYIVALLLEYHMSARCLWIR